TNADELLESVDLTRQKKTNWRKLSGGEKQRLSLALALAAKPRIAFLDEPTSGVDIFGRDLIRNIVRQLAADGCAVIMATHELDEAQRVADHVLMFQSGQLLANAPMTELQNETGQRQTLEDIFRNLAEKSKSQGTQ
ncbi:MAG: ATP-binding cassette domain-containing protein, partial [Ilumatobacteraceae bacterium]